jgi:hypothetical protein
LLSDFGQQRGLPLELLRQRLDGAERGWADVVFHAFDIVIDDLLIEAKEFEEIREQLVPARDVQRERLARRGVRVAGPGVEVQVGMGENILILAFVVIVIGGIGSIRGALVGAILVGMVDTLGRAFIPQILREFLTPAFAGAIGPALASILIYLIMAGVLFWRPQGLFPARG